MLELEAAKEMLADVYDIQVGAVDDLIQQRIVDFRLGVESRLYASSKAHLS
jgi:hypothetical protein